MIFCVVFLKHTKNINLHYLGEAQNLLAENFFGDFFFCVFIIFGWLGYVIVFLDISVGGQTTTLFSFEFSRRS